MKTRRGDVVLVLFPNSDLRTAKRRPALVIQRDHLASGLNQTIVAMIYVLTASNPTSSQRIPSVEMQAQNERGAKGWPARRAILDRAARVAGGSHRRYGAG